MGNGSSSSYTVALEVQDQLGMLKPHFEPWQQRKSYAPEDLKTQINHMIIILEPLVCETIHKMRNFFYPITKYTPKFLSTANLYHASIFVYKDSKDSGILAEFGIYNKLREGDHSSLVHYYNDEENGLRYAKYNFYTLQNELSSETITIECETPYFVGLQCLFEKCVADAHKKFKSNDYNLLSSNCQYFVAKAIKKSGAYRTSEEFRKEKRNPVVLPPRILKQLKRNESNRSYHY